MRKIKFYKSKSGKSPVLKFLKQLTAKQKKKSAFVFSLVEELDIVPKEYFKKLIGTDDLWEIRIQSGNNIFRILGFLDGKNLVILNHAFVKKSQKTPKKEIKIAEKRKQEYLKEQNE